ncbi:hypothetical protein ACOSP7_005416 [Xanthoceras sorbifolium]
MEAQAWGVWMLGVRLPLTRFKVNIDTAFDLNLERHNIAAIIRDSRGVLVFVATQCFEGLVEVELAEAKVVLLGLQLAADDGLCEVKLESDALSIIKLIYGELFLGMRLRF